MHLRVIVNNLQLHIIIEDRQKHQLAFENSTVDETDPSDNLFTRRSYIPEGKNCNVDLVE